MDMATCVARRTRSRTDSYLNSLLNRTKTCSSPPANSAKRRRLRRASDDDDAVFIETILTEGKRQHEHVEEDDNVGSASVIPPRLGSKLPDCYKVGDFPVEDSKLKPGISKPDEVISLSSDEEGSVEELGIDSSVDENKNSESDFDCSEIPSEKVYTQGKRKTSTRKNNLKVFELLEKSIWEEEVDSREPAIVRENSSVHKERKPRKEKKYSCDGLKTIHYSTQDSPPLNLRFGCEESDSELIEKTEEEKEIDSLWEDMALALTLERVHSSTFTAKVRTCSNGEHDFIIDEEIGQKCRYCSYVAVEIKDISPPMDKYHANVNNNKKKIFSSVKKDDLKLEFDEASNHSNNGNDIVDSLNDDTEGTVWKLIPGIKDTLYQHQREGFEFIWKNIAGTIKLNELDSSSSEINKKGGCIISHSPGTGKTRLSIVFLQSYLKKFPDSCPVVIAPASLLLTWEEEFNKWNSDIPFCNLNRHHKSVRMVKLNSWRKKTSVLGVSYNLYEKLAGGEKQEFRKMLLELPGLVILDEGHTPRNQNSSIWKVLSEVKTEKRIILSGTPFQNNFKELCNVLCLTRPAYKAKISSRLQDLSRNGTDEEIKELKDMIAPFVHVHKGNILRESLPGLKDCVVVLKPTYQQMKILDRIDSCQNTLLLEHKVSSVSVHPSLYLHCESTKRERLLIGPSVLQTLKKVKLDFNEGVKTKFLMDLLRCSESLNEKVLVFSQYIKTLKLIKAQIKAFFNWNEGEEILFVHGTLEQRERQNLINKFNKEDSEAKVLLASTKACSEGINLVGASRVVLLDVVWNPSVESQAISRAYRIGQKRVVYTYHLMVKGTYEWDKYCTQTKKHRISELVFSSSTNEKVMNKEVVSEDRILDEMVSHEKKKDMFEKILYHPKESHIL